MKAMRKGFSLEVDCTCHGDDFADKSHAHFSLKHAKQDPAFPT